MLTSTQNPLVKATRKLHQGKYRRAHQQFLLEGTHLVREALNVSYPLEMAFFTPEWVKQHPHLQGQLIQAAQRTEVVSDEVLKALATTITPAGVVAVAPQRSWASPAVTTLGLAVETLQDPGNLGTLIRTGVATGINGIWLNQDSVAPDHPKVLRASAGQWFHMATIVSNDLAKRVGQWRHQGLQVIATCADGDTDYWSVNFLLPSMILLGNEGAGLSSALLDLADIKVKIPMEGNVESLNVGIAAALLLYEAKRQRQVQSQNGLP
jgi:TrmH family RNA methyltransferase